MNTIKILFIVSLFTLLPKLSESSASKSKLSSTRLATKPSQSSLFNFPANLTDIVLGSTANSPFDNTPALITALNQGKKFIGQIAIDTDKKMCLTLSSSDKSVTVHGTFVGEPNQISYKCIGTGYANVSVKGITDVTIQGNKTEAQINISGNVTDILLGGIENSHFDHYDDLIKALNMGETFIGTIDANRVLILKSATTTATGIFVKQPNQISYKCESYTNTPVTYGTTITITGKRQPQNIIITVTDYLYSFSINGMTEKKWYPDGWYNFKKDTANNNDMFYFVNTKHKSIYAYIDGNMFYAYNNSIGYLENSGALDSSMQSFTIKYATGVYGQNEHTIQIFRGDTITINYQS